MKLFPPEPAIELYEDGFKDHDKLDRAGKGLQLSNLVEQIEDPMVIALDGAWGDGKSFFLKCWVGAHVNENSGTAKTVYFDAYAHDYLDNPLIALTGVLSERFESDADKSQLLEGLKSIGAKLWRPAIRVGLAVGTAGASEVAGAVVDAGLEAGSKELADASEAFWKREDGKRAAMNQFLGTLAKLTSDGDGNAQKIVIVVDELDRCRPDYALETLEVIKHFFAIPSVHFVLGVNLRELENSVRARYGAGVSARLYLEKFITLSISLTSQVKKKQSNDIQALSYYDFLLSEMKLRGDWNQLAREYLELPNIQSLLTLRGVEKLVTSLALIPNRDFTAQPAGQKIIVFGLLILKHFQPQLFEKAKAGSLLVEEVVQYFGTANPENPRELRRYKNLHEKWAFVLKPESIDYDTSTAPNSFGPFILDFDEARNLLPEAIVQFVDTFEVFETEKN